MTFHEWLLNHTKRNNPLGDLARDYEQDKKGQKETLTPEEFYHYLFRRGACHEAIAAAKRAGRQWRKTGIPQ